MYKAIKTCKKHMNRGDCYLINIANTITISKNKKFISSIDFFNSWEVLRPRYGIYYKDKNKGIACFSPERFIACKNKVIISEPIKGTLKIENKSAKIDDAKIIWNNKKEIYEHTLVVDLLRNDLNYVCQPGSVKVFLPFFARISGKLIQMQSSIIGKLANNNSLASCLEKMLPAGSISGTPKKKACELIANYEDLPRGYYTGISGILEKNGDFDIAILIRSLYMGKRGVYIGVGSGITTLSEIKMELKELEIKLKSFSRIFQGIL